MVVNHVTQEIHHVIPEMYLSAYMYFWNYMADNHVILETCFWNFCRYAISELHGMDYIPG
jgi:hypothetical protein